MTMTRRMYFVPTPALQAKTTLFPAELTDLLANAAVRQLAIFKDDAGWMLKVLPSWKPDFYTLVHHSRKKEIRYYTSLDRLLSSITRSAPLPPTILFGEIA
ncbi:MAG: hypothetical protein JSR64_09735 [Nitrospira sp.]|nr:hypothetical protein [Nitrospira sp.]MBS0194369.1 hypothetical protein [Pseudomonadota bacterium]